MKNIGKFVSLKIGPVIIVFEINCQRYIFPRVVTV